MELLNKLRQLDAYPKISEDFYQRSFSGGVITILSSTVIVFLFFTELSLFLHGNIENELIVDTSRGERLQINDLSNICLITMKTLGNIRMVIQMLFYYFTSIFDGSLYTQRLLFKYSMLPGCMRWPLFPILSFLSDKLCSYMCEDNTWFDVTFPALACSLLSLDAMDISGDQHFDVKHDIIKKRLDASGNVIEMRSDGIGGPKIDKPLQRHGGRLEHNETYCGSCYGAEVSDDDCCNSCEEVRDAYRVKGWGMTNPDSIDQCKREGYLNKIKGEAGEGCNIYGSLEVNKVAGNFHFAPGKSFQYSGMHVHDLMSFQTENINVSHTIHKLAFGAHFPGVVNPLDGVQWTQEMKTGMYQYFIKVVPTVYSDIGRNKILTNQFSVTEHFRAMEFGMSGSLPGVFFFYDLSPIKVTFREERASFLHFLTNICAIIGGIFTVSGIIDSFVYHGQRAIRKKVEIGKFG